MLQHSDAIDLLNEEHQQVRNLCSEMHELLSWRRSPEGLLRTATRLRCALLIHIRLEEEMFYPNAFSLAPEVREAQKVALEEHRVIRWYLEQVHGPEIQHAARWIVLMELVERHLLREEYEIFPAVQKGLTAMQADELVMALQLTREALVEPVVADGPPIGELKDPARKRSVPLMGPRFTL